MLAARRCKPAACLVAGGPSFKFFVERADLVGQFRHAPDQDFKRPMRKGWECFICKRVAIFARTNGAPMATRPRDGFTTKIHLRVNVHELPMRTAITPGQTSDYLGFDLVMADNLPEPKVLLADREYDADRIRKTRTSAISSRKSQCERPAKCVFVWIIRFTGCVTWSSVASTNSKTRGVSQPVTTKPQRVFWASSTLRQYVSGSVICQHDLNCVIEAVEN